MSTTLTGNVKATISTQFNDTSTDDLETPLSTVGITGPGTSGITITDGAGANQAQVQFTKTASLAAAAAVSFDFQGGGLVDAFGTAIALSEMKLLYVENSGTTDSTLKISGNLYDVVTGVASSAYLVPPGQCFLGTFFNAAGVAVTATTADTITLTHNNDGTVAVTYKIVVLGN